MVDFVIIKSCSLIIERFNSPVTYSMIKKASFAIWAHPDYDPNFKGLVDIRGCVISKSLIEMTKAAYFFITNAQTAKGFMVILADSNEGIASSFIFNYKVSKFMNIHVVGSFEEALRNLGITEKEYEQLNSEAAIKVHSQEPN